MQRKAENYTKILLEDYDATFRGFPNAQKIINGLLDLQTNPQQPLKPRSQSFPPLRPHRQPRPGFSRKKSAELSIKPAESQPGSQVPDFPPHRASVGKVKAPLLQRQTSAPPTQITPQALSLAIEAMESLRSAAKLDEDPDQKPNNDDEPTAPRKKTMTM